jgi:hypothetical protein
VESICEPQAIAALLGLAMLGTSVGPFDSSIAAAWF